MVVMAQDDQLRETTTAHGPEEYAMIYYTEGHRWNLKKNRVVNVSPSMEGVPKKEAGVGSSLQFNSLTDYAHFLSTDGHKWNLKKAIFSF